MKIAIFTDTYLPAVDGVVNSVLASKKTLEGMGHEVVVFAPQDLGNGHARDPGVIYVKAREFRGYPGYRLAMFPGREVDQVKELGVDIIHNHGVGFMGIKGMWAAWQAKIPMVQTFHTMLTDTVSYYSPFRLKLSLLQEGLRLYLRIFLHKCKSVVVPTRAVLDELLSLAPRMKVSDVIPTGVDVQRFHPKLTGAAIRSKWNLNGHETILYVGRVSPEKNLTLLLNAFPMVRREHPEARLMIVGKGPYLRRYYELARKRDLIGQVIFTGFVPDQDLPRYYAACDTFALPSKFETQGLVVLEALASGKPVAGANYRAIPEFVEHGKNGYLFDPSRTERCADAICQCLESGDDFSPAARATGEAFSVERCTRRLVSVYRKALNGWAS